MKPKKKFKKPKEISSPAQTPEAVYSIQPCLREKKRPTAEAAGPYQPAIPMAALPLLRWGASSLRAHSSPPPPRRLFSAIRRPPAASRCEPGSRVMLKGMDYPELEVRALFQPSGIVDSSVSYWPTFVFLAYFRARFSQKWVQSQGFRPGQAMMLWKRLYGNNVWAHCPDELAGRSQFLLHSMKYSRYMQPYLINSVPGAKSEISPHLRLR